MKRARRVLFPRATLSGVTLSRILLTYVLICVVSWGAASPEEDVQSVASTQNSLEASEKMPRFTPEPLDGLLVQPEVTPPGTGVNAALQGANTPFKRRRFKISLAENDIMFSDKGLSQFLELLYTRPLGGASALNTAIKFEMVTPKQVFYLSPEGEERCCESPGTYHYPLYLEHQLVRRVPLGAGLSARLSAQVQTGVDAPEEIGGPLQNMWHGVIGSPDFDAVGEATFYGGLGGSALLEGRLGSLSYFVGPSMEVTTLERSAGLLQGLTYDAAPLALQAFAVTERIDSRYFTPDFERGRRATVGLSAALRLGGANFGDWTPTLGFSVLYDYNSVVPEMSNLRYSFVPVWQISVPVD